MALRGDVQSVEYLERLIHICVLYDLLSEGYGPISERMFGEVCGVHELVEPSADIGLVNVKGLSDFNLGLAGVMERQEGRDFIAAQMAYAFADWLEGGIRHSWRLINLECASTL